MYLLWLKSLLRVCVETMMFLVWSSRRITSSTVVLRTLGEGTESEQAVVRRGRRGARGGGLRLQREWRVASHEKVAARRGDEGGNQAHQVIVHVARISERGRAGSHDGGDERVRLGEGGVVDVQPVHRDAVQSRVVQHHHAVTVQSEPLQREHGVVRLHHHIARLVLIREDAVRLHQLLAVPVIQRLQQVRPHARPCPASYRVAQHEALQAVAPIRLPVNHVHQILLHRLRLRIPAGPVVPGAPAVAG